MENGSLPCLDLFCGAGGMSLGLEAAGFTTVYAADHDRHAAATFDANFHRSPEVVDLENLDPKDLLRRANVAPGELALVCGGPPCQGFSIQRRGSANDPRNNFIVQFTLLALAAMPRFILLENVPTVGGARGHRYLTKAVELLAKDGYVIHHDVLNAADYGVPQFRRRFFLVAQRSDVRGQFSFPRPIRAPSDYRTVRMAINDLPTPPEEPVSHPDFPNHVRVRISALNRERISHVPEGGGREHIPLHLQLPCHRTNTGHRHLDVYGRMSWDYPAPTITALFNNFTRGRFAHPREDRNITAREGCRLQSFPDNFVFLGPQKDISRQIGNAVPPDMARAIGESIRTTLQTAPTPAPIREDTLI